MKTKMFRIEFLFQHYMVFLKHHPLPIFRARTWEEAEAWCKQH